MAAFEQGVDGMWICQACGSANYAQSLQCSLCKTERHHVNLANPQATPFRIQQMYVGHHQTHHTGAQSVVSSGYQQVQTPIRIPVTSVSEAKVMTAHNPKIHAVTQYYTNTQPAAYAAAYQYQPTVAAAYLHPQQIVTEATPILQHQQHRQQKGNWICSACKNVNFPYRTKCNLCTRPRPSTEELQREAAASAFFRLFSTFEEGMQYLRDLKPSQVMRTKRNASTRPIHGVNGAWRCGSAECGNINFAKRRFCNLCKLPRPPESPTAKIAHSESLDGMSEKQAQLNQTVQEQENHQQYELEGYEYPAPSSPSPEVFQANMSVPKPESISSIK